MIHHKLLSYLHYSFYSVLMRFYISEILVSENWMLRLLTVCLWAGFSPTCPTVRDRVGHCDASPVWQLAARVHLSVYLPCCVAWASCLPHLPVCLPAWFLLHVAAMRGRDWGRGSSNQRVQCAIDLRLFDCIRTRTLAATDADSCGCTLRLKLLPPPPASPSLLLFCQCIA